jgi:hypothetical protein
MESCEVLRDDCSTAFPLPNVIWFSTTKPLTMYAATNIELGYSHDVCVRCTNGVETVDTGITNAITVNLPSCLSTLLTTSTTFSDRLLVYDASAATPYVSPPVSYDTVF